MGILQHSSTRPALIVPITGTTQQAINKTATAIATTDADLIEWRADHFTELANTPKVETTARMIKEITHKPLLFTIRSAAEGGKGQLHAADYATTILRVTTNALDHNDYVDVELRHPGAKQVLLSRRKLPNLGATIVSHHDVSGTPSINTMHELLEDCAALSDGAVKLAVTPHNAADVATLLLCAAQFTARHAIPTIAIAMGTTGLASRVVGHLFGSCATFASLDTPSAPGQLSYQQAQRLRTELS
ncbi:MAG: type I 3-dehydroquinate dehydratase [Propionibacteriaceae bacterium]|nr:type I 3-dehydroquinate dehydratase [Propionibacteriaceae bacterium]